jgi:hypothetical protein
MQDNALACFHVNHRFANVADLVNVPEKVLEATLRPLLVWPMARARRHRRHAFPMEQHHEPADLRVNGVVLPHE